MKTSRYLVFSILLSMVLCSSFILVWSEKPSTVNGLQLELFVNDSSGKLLDYRIEKSDLILLNKARLLCDIFRGSGTNLRLRNIAGNWFYPQAGSAGPQWIQFTGASALIHIGTGTSPADVADFSLNNEYATFAPSSWAYSWLGPGHSQVNLTITGIYSASGSETITESGLSIYIESSTGTTYYRALMTRDVFTGFPIVSGNIVTVKYTWIMNG